MTKDGLCKLSEHLRQFRIITSAPEYIAKKFVWWEEGVKADRRDFRLLTAIGDTVI